MRKSISYILLLLLAVALVLPAYTGFVAEKKMQHLLELIAETWGVQVKLDKYHRGWFHSKATYSVAIMPTAASKTKTMLIPPVQIKQRIIHGPFIVNNGLSDKFMLKFGIAFIKFDIEAATTAATDFHFSQTSLGKGQLLVNFNGNTEGIFFTPSVAMHKVGKELKINIGNMKTQMHMSRSFKEITKNTRIGELVIKNQHITSNLSDIKLDNQYKHHEHGLWLGNTKFSLPFVTLALDEQNKIIVKDLQAASTSELLGNVVNATFSMAVEKMIINGVAHGPGNYRVVINNLDARTLMQINQLFKQIAQSRHDANQQTVLHQQIIQLLPELISRGLQVRIQSLMLRTAIGEISAQAWLTLPDLHKHSKVTLVDLFKGVDTAFSIKVPKQLVAAIMHYYLLYQQQLKLATDATDAQALALSTSSTALQQLVDKSLQQWLADNLLTDEGALYGVSIVYKNNQLYINGQLQDKAINP